MVLLVIGTETPPIVTVAAVTGRNPTPVMTRTSPPRGEMMRGATLTLLSLPSVSLLMTGDAFASVSVASADCMAGDAGGSAE